MTQPSAPLDHVNALAAPGHLFTRQDDGRLECQACAHRCHLREGNTGRCGVRWRRGDVVMAPFGYVAARRVRPVETNTVYHVRPGTLALTIGMYGCDLRCPYCQNWRLSQALREDTKAPPPMVTTARGVVDDAIAGGCQIMCAAYNEPMIAAEWLHGIFTHARARGMMTGIVSDGNTTREALEYLRPVTDFYRVDLKAFTEEQYTVLGGRLATVIEAIRRAHALAYWVEVVTLVVPGFNDNLQGLRSLATTLAAINAGIPWHLNAFYPRYRWSDRGAQGAALLISAAGAAYARGLRYVYVGNLADRVSQLSHTRCPRCHAVLVERRDYRTISVALVNGCCPSCGLRPDGLWQPLRIAA